MKSTIFFLLISLYAHAQTVVTKDTTWQTNAGGSFFLVHLVEYSNGESSLTKNLVGDTATLFRASLVSFEVASNRMANVAFEARDFDKDIRDLLQRSDSILLHLEKDVIDTLAAKYGQPLLQNGWTVIEGASSLDVAFSINAQGQLRYQIAGFPVRNAQLLGRTMRLQNYKATGDKLDVYNAPGGNWFSIDNKVRIRFPGNQGLNRSAAKPPGIEAETIKIEPVSQLKKASKPNKKNK